MDEASKIKQEESQKFIIEELESKEWITVYYLSPHNQKENIAIFSAIIPSTIISELLDDYIWDVTFDFGKPSISQILPQEEVNYSKFEGNTGIEPLIILQSFYGLHEKILNFSEEFRLFHNLFWDGEKKAYQIITLDSGELEDVVRFGDHSIKIKNKYIKQFCAFKKMHLAIYFDIFYFSNLSLANIEVAEEFIDRRGEDYHLTVYWDDYRGFNKSYKSFSRLLGKKYIKPMLLEDTGIWPFEKPKKYEEFIIGIDENVNHIIFTCNTEELADYYGKNPNSPHYLTPVFFRRGVLQKYLGFPEKYEVLDGLINCGNLWNLQIDNNHPEYIIVYLGDLGYLSNSEQIYWKSFNISPQGSISLVAFNRDFRAEFTDPVALDLIFKIKYNSINKFWVEKYNWFMFLPLKPEERFHLSSLHIPVTSSQQEFDNQVLSLTKLIIDSLNEKALNSQIGEQDKNNHGITKLEKYLSSLGKKDFEKHIIFLRNLQSLRSTGIAHRKGKKYQKASEIFGIGKKNTQVVFEELLSSSIAFLDYLLSDEN